ncbi:MAG: hypothetical protein R3B91_20585 [Planctomycetaceae bacterium]
MWFPHVAKRPSSVCLAWPMAVRSFEEFFDLRGIYSAPFEQVGNFFLRWQWRRLLFEVAFSSLHRSDAWTATAVCDRNGWFRDGRFVGGEVDLFLG